MRILQVIPFLWSGAGNVLTRLCLAQAAAGHEVGIVTSGRSKGMTDWPEYRKQLKAAGVRHFQIDLFDRSPEVFWRSVEEFGKLTRAWKPDLIHCHAGVPACAASLSGSRFIAQVHSWGVGRPEWMNTMDLEGLRHAERVLCGSIAYQKILVNGGIDPERIRYIPWGLDLSLIRDGRWQRESPPREEGCPKGGVVEHTETFHHAQPPRRFAPPLLTRRGLPTPFSIGFLGRIEPRKNQLELTKAFARFHKRHPESKLEFIGPVADIDYRDEISTFISKSGLTGAVKLRGRVTNPYPKVRGWNLFTSLSSDEGQGIAILEAMALGVPVLGRRVAGVEDYLHDRRTGIAVGSASPQEVSERMDWAVHHQKDLATIASRAKRMVETDYNWTTTVQQMNSLYETVTRTNSRLD